MLAGTHSGTSTPVSRKYADKLDWALKKLWEANEVKPSFDALNADAVRKVFARFQFDEEARQDYYSSKMQIYKAVSSFGTESLVWCRSKVEFSDISIMFAF